MPTNTVSGKETQDKFDNPPYQDYATMSNVNFIGSNSILHPHTQHQSNHNINT